MKTAYAMIAACALAGCSTVTVTSDYDRTAPFATYKTYSISPAAKGQTMSPSSETVLRDSIRAEFGARGLREAQGGKADVVIARHVFLRDKVSVQEYTDWGYGWHGGWPYGFGHYGMWAGAPRTYVDVNQYTEGTLILDLVDRKTSKLVYRGIGKAVAGDAESNAKKIREAVKKMAENLPLAKTQ